MSLFQGDHLRISTPRTVDGLNLEYGPDGRPIFDIQFAPLESRKFFEQENKLRPNQIKHILEEVRTGFGVTNKPQPTQTKVNIKQ